MRTVILLLLLTILCTCAPSPATSDAEKADLPEAPRHEWPREAPVKMILDSDTANEIDDLFAIAYLVTEDYPGFELLGISSAQWFHVWSGDSTVYQSQQLNEELLDLAGRSDLPHPLGADLIMGKPWGDYDPRDSPAAQFIIDETMALNDDEKLVVMCIGAATNLASAIALQPEIKDRIVAYTLGFRYDFDGGFWNKDEFNIRRDLNAANYLLNAEGLELHVMPISVAIEYTWDRNETFGQLGKAGEIGAYLRKRWETSAGPDATKWTMWDVALLQAFLKPEQASEISVPTPPENTPRSVWMYEDIDPEAMAEDFWLRLNKK
ncbi:nucleoside hydrolase [Neolewinella aurantiaca]|nr:nucleoside hydrolase [Neolewinella aurantiaca]